MLYDLGRACCDTDNFLFVAAGRERLSVSQRETSKCDFDRKKLNDVEVKEKYMDDGDVVGLGEMLDS